jgi:hypothetical protein
LFSSEQRLAIFFGVCSERQNVTFSSFFFALNSGNPLDDLNALQNVAFVMKVDQPINRDTNEHSSARHSLRMQDAS